MRDLPFFSIVVPIFNGQAYLEECLQSIQKQTFTNFECILVDDGSTDASKEICTQIVSNDSRFTYAFKENGGLSSARNFGVSKAVASYIFPIDCDDYIHAKALEILANKIMASQNPAVVYFDVRYVGLKNHVYILPNYSYKRLLVQNCFIACSVFKKEIWEQVNGYDETLKALEDWDFWMRALSENSKVVKVSKILYFYRQHGDANMRSQFKKNEAFYWGLYEQIYLKNKALYQAHFGHPIQELKDKMDADEFVAKIKNTVLFEIYHFIKQKIR